MFTVIKTTPFFSIPAIDSPIARVQDIQVSRPAEDFELNAFGFPLNEISALNGARSVQEYNELLDRIQVYQANNPDTSKMSIQELIENVAPRSYQTPSEVLQAATWLGSRMQEKVDVANQKFAEKISSTQVSQSPAPSADGGVTTT